MSKPEYVKVEDKLYKINTDFRVAIECNEIARDNSIGDYERALAIIYKLFGEEGLDCNDIGKLLELGIKYITIDNQEGQAESKNKYELDYNKCKGLIQSSFKFDYKYDPYELEYLHWYDFYNDLQNLSSSEFGTCCVLNRIASTLEIDVSKIKDSKERAKIIEAQKEIRKKYCVENKREMSEKEKRNVADLYEKIGLWKGGK